MNSKSQTNQKQNKKLLLDISMINKIEWNEHFTWLNTYLEAPIFHDHGKGYLKRNSQFSAKTLITSKKQTLLSKQTFQRHFENINGQYLTTLIFVNVRQISLTQTWSPVIWFKCFRWFNWEKLMIFFNLIIIKIIPLTINLFIIFIKS